MRIPTAGHLQSTVIRVLISLLAAILALAVLAPAGAGAQDVRVKQQSARRTGARAALLSGLGRHRHAITTRSPNAQRYFNQGLALAYGRMADVKLSASRF